MALVLDGSANTIAGLAAGGLPAGSVTSATLAAGAGGKILQVKESIPTAAVTISTGSAYNWNNISQLNVAITPAANTSKFLINVQIGGEGTYSDHGVFFKLTRTVSGSATDIGIGDADSTDTRCTAMLPPCYGAGADNDTTSGFFNIPNYLDYPFGGSGTVSEVTYGVSVMIEDNSKTFYLNDVVNQGDAAGHEKTASWRTVMEIGA